MKFVSIFWLYFSCDLMFQLPIEPFETIQEEKEDSYTSESQNARMAFLIEECLKLANFGGQEGDEG